MTVSNISNIPVNKPPQPFILRVCPPSQTPPSRMPHALSMASTGLQALILCGPGSSFPTFTSNPDENPKALLPIANRPMVWYPIDFCLRTGITSKRTSVNSPALIFPVWDLSQQLSFILCATSISIPKYSVSRICGRTIMLRQGPQVIRIQRWRLTTLRHNSHLSPISLKSIDSCSQHQPLSHSSATAAARCLGSR